jgi:hypothetical protein
MDCLVGLILLLVADPFPIERISLIDPGRQRRGKGSATAVSTAATMRSGAESPISSTVYERDPPKVVRSETDISQREIGSDF